MTDEIQIKGEDSLNADSIRKTFKLKWKKPPTLDELKQDTQNAEAEVQTAHAKIKHWNSLRDAKRKTSAAGRSTIVPKLIRKQNEWRYAALSEPFLSADNIFDSRPVTFEDKMAAEHNKLIINYQFNNLLDKVAFIDELVRTIVDEGTAWVRVGWEYRDQEIQEEVTYQDPNTGEIFTSIEDTIEVLENKPTLEVCDYTSVIPDPTCEGNLNKANFVIYRYTTNKADLQADGRYKNLDKMNIEGIVATNVPDVNFTFQDKARKKFTVYEYWGYWDIEDDGVLVPILAVYAGSTLIRLEENPYPDGKPPFVKINYLPVKKSLFGETDAELIEDNQEIIGAVTRGVIDLLARSSNSQQGVMKGLLDTNNHKRFINNENYEFNNVGMDISRAVYMHKFPEIPSSALNIIGMQNVDAESLTGVKAYHDGIGGDSLGRTATGARGAMDAASKREMGILRRISDGIVEIGYKIMSMNAVFLSEEETIRITNEDFVDITRDSLDGRVDIFLTISTAEADNEKAENLSFMLQTLGNSMPLEMTQLVLADIAKLRKMPDLAKQIAEYAPEPDPAEQHRTQLELQLLEAQIMYTQARAQEYGAGAQLKGSKIEVEGARARKMHSDADKGDLDFMHDMDGTIAQRALEQQNNATRNKLDEAAGIATMNRGMAAIDNMGKE